MAIGLQIELPLTSVACVQLFTICHGGQIPVMSMSWAARRSQAYESGVTMVARHPYGPAPNRVAADGMMVSQRTEAYAFMGKCLSSRTEIHHIDTSPAHIMCPSFAAVAAR